MLTQSSSIQIIPHTFGIFLREWSRMILSTRMSPSPVPCALVREYPSCLRDMCLIGCEPCLCGPVQRYEACASGWDACTGCTVCGLCASSCLLDQMCSSEVTRGDGCEKPPRPLGVRSPVWRLPSVLEDESRGGWHGGSDVVATDPPVFAPGSGRVVRRTKLRDFLVQANGSRADGPSIFVLEGGGMTAVARVAMRALLWMLDDRNHSEGPDSRDFSALAPEGAHGMFMTSPRRATCTAFIVDSASCFVTAQHCLGSAELDVGCLSAEHVLGSAELRFFLGSFRFTGRHCVGDCFVLPACSVDPCVRVTCTSPPCTCWSGDGNYCGGNETPRVVAAACESNPSYHRPFRDLRRACASGCFVASPGNNDSCNLPPPPVSTSGCCSGKRDYCGGNETPRVVAAACASNTSYFCDVNVDGGWSCALACLREGSDRGRILDPRGARVSPRGDRRAVVGLRSAQRHPLPPMVWRSAPPSRGSAGASSSGGSGIQRSRSFAPHPPGVRPVGWFWRPGAGALLPRPSL